MNHNQDRMAASEADYLRSTAARNGASDYERDWADAMADSGPYPARVVSTPATVDARQRQWRQVFGWVAALCAFGAPVGLFAALVYVQAAPWIFWSLLTGYVAALLVTAACVRSAQMSRERDE